MLTINISELLLTILSFFILMFLLNKLLFKPVIEFREQRQKRMDDCYEQERIAKEKLSETEKELSCRRQDSLKEADSILSAARVQAQEETAKTAKQAETEAEEKFRKEADATEQLRSAEDKSLKEKHGQLASSLADRLCN